MHFNTNHVYPTTVQNDQWQHNVRYSNLELNMSFGDEVLWLSDRSYGHTDLFVVVPAAIIDVN